MNNDELLKIAKEASKNAYAPYSEFHVGACALYESGNSYPGCNVENASYGLCLCAERNAMSGAIVSGEKSNLLKIAVYSPNTTHCIPCGACLSWMAEFEFDKNIKIVLEGKDGNPEEYTLDEMLPFRFKLGD